MKARVAGEEVVDRLAAHDDARLSPAHGDDRRSGDVVVVAREREAVGAGRGDGEQVAGRDVARQVLGVDDDVARLAVLADHAREHGCRVALARGDACRELRAVERRARVVAHAAVDAHVEAGRVVVQRDGLGRADLVERHARLPDDGAAGFEREIRHRDAAHGALAGDGVGDAGGELLDGRGVVGRGVRDAESPAEVEDGDARRRRGARRGVRRGAPPTPGTRAVPKIWDPMWQWSPTKARPGTVADPRDGGRGILKREAELLILVRRREEVVRLGVDAAVDPQQHALRDAAALDDRREALDLDRAVDDDGADAGLDGPLELGDALVVAVEAQSRRVGTRGECHRELARRADVDGESLLGDPADDLGGQERLARVVDPRLHAVEGGRGPERVERAARVLAHLVLVDHVERRSELLAQRGDRHIGDAEDAVVGARRGIGPDARREGVRVIRHGEPRGGQRAGVRGGGHGWDQSVGASAQGRPDRPSARMPRPVDARAGQCLKSRARAIRPSRRASHTSRSGLAGAVLLQSGVGDDRAVDVEVGDERLSPSTATDVKVRPAGMYCARHTVQSRSTRSATGRTDRGARRRDLGAGELQRGGREHEVAVRRGGRQRHSHREAETPKSESSVDIVTSGSCEAEGVGREPVDRRHQRAQLLPRRARPSRSRCRSSPPRDRDVVRDDRHVADDESDRHVVGGDRHLAERADDQLRDDRARAPRPARPGRPGARAA